MNRKTNIKSDVCVWLLHFLRRRESGIIVTTFAYFSVLRREKVKIYLSFFFVMYNLEFVQNTLHTIYILKKSMHSVVVLERA